MRFLLALLVVAGVAGAARADEVDSDQTQPAAGSAANWTVGVGTYARWYNDRSAASLTPARMFGPQVSVGRRLMALHGPRGGVVLSLRTRIAGGSSDGQIFQQLDTHIGQLAVTAGPHLELDLWRGLSASAQLELGAARTNVSIGDTTYAMAPVDDTVWHMIGTATAGLGFNGRIRGRFTIALFVDVGWTFTQSIAVHANPQSHPDPELSIDTTYAALGHLDTGGLTASTSLRFGF